MVPKPTPMGLNLPVPWPTRRIRSTRPRSAGAPPACSGMPRCGPQPRGASPRARANLRVMRKTHGLVPTTAEHLQGCDQRATGSAGLLVRMVWNATNRQSGNSERNEASRGWLPKFGNGAAFRSEAAK